MTAALLYTAGVLIFVFALMASIALHELGHLVPAKKFGGKITQYFIGFGPTVWSKQVGETECGVKAIPLGGYVKIVGMLPPGAEQLADEVTVDDEGNQVTRIRKSNTGIFTQLISDARAAEWELVKPGDEERLFYKMPWWKKVIVMSGGPSVNLVIAFVFFLALFAIWGVNTAEPVVDEVSQCVIPAAEKGRDCTAADEEAPAHKAGLQKGDVITSFNGVEVTGWDQLRELIRENDAGRAEIGFLRDGEQRTSVTSTTVEARPTSPTDETLREVGFLGVLPTVVVEKGGPIFTLEKMGTMTVEVVRILGTLPAKVWDVGEAIVGLEERDPEGPVSIVGGGRIAGETASHEGLEVGEKTQLLILLIASFNLFIGLLNFVPLLPLDGGHIASALWEALRRGIARLRGRPDPGYVDAAKLLPVAYVMASALLVMGVVLIVGDLVVPLHLQS